MTTDREQIVDYLRWWAAEQEKTSRQSRDPDKREAFANRAAALTDAADSIAAFDDAGWAREQAA